MKIGYNSEQYSEQVKFRGGGEFLNSEVARGEMVLLGSQVVLDGGFQRGFPPLG